MYTKRDLINSISKDTAILKHLAEKITPEMLDYKPTEKQRTLLELMQYIGCIIASSAEVIYQNNTDVYGTMFAHSTSITLDNFAHTLDAQLVMFTETINKFTDENLQEVVNIYGGGDNTKGSYLVDFCVKMSAAYKMQMFLYMKSAGIEDIGTPNLWAGMDMQ